MFLVDNILVRAQRFSVRHTHSDQMSMLVTALPSVSLTQLVNKHDDLLFGVSSLRLESDQLLWVFSQYRDVEHIHVIK